MRIALTFPECHRRGGVERVMLECANFLARRGHEAHVFSTAFEDAALDRAAVRHVVPHTFAGGAPALLDFACRSRRALAAAGPFDVLSSFGVQSPTDGVLWMQSVHKAWMRVSRSLRRGVARYRQLVNPFHPAALAFERHVVGGRRYRKLIALTRQVKDDLIELYDVPPEDVEIVPNGFNPAEFNPADDDGVTRGRVRRELLGAAGDDATRIVLFVANELERKGFRPLLRAVARLARGDVRVVAVGRFDPTPCLAEIESLGLGGAVTFLPSTNDLKPLYLAADLFALPTQYEAWGLVLVEAMACGLPVLTSRLAGASVAVDEGRSGLLLDDPTNVDEIAAKLYDALGLRESVGAADVAASVSAYRWDRVLPAYEQILHDCANPAGEEASRCASPC